MSEITATVEGRTYVLEMRQIPAPGEDWPGACPSCAAAHDWRLCHALGERCMSYRAAAWHLVEPEPVPADSEFEAARRIAAATMAQESLRALTTTTPNGKGGAW